jgi:predicted NBD/HSP70 family sugar kinase
MQAFVGVGIDESRICVGYINGNGQLLNVTADTEINLATLTGDGLISIIKSLVEKSKDESWVISSIGIECPGWSKNGVLVRAYGMPHIQNFDVASELNKHYPNIPVFLLNDADAAINTTAGGYASAAASAKSLHDLVYLSSP